ncbi:MAG TPA: hypothetical protein ENN19_19375 [Chloroflexi bacterium]|nr:hypothetical protein [Chloroflexota bacterium]
MNRDHLSVLVAVLLLGSVLFRFIELPNQTWRLQLFGSPMEIRLTGTWLLTLLMIGLVCTGANLILHGHPHLADHPERPIYVSWILPGLLTGLSAYLLEQIVTGPVWIAGLLFAAVAISLTISAEYTVVSPKSSGYPATRLALNMLAYLLAFILFTVIYQTRSRSIITATLMMLVAGVLALDLLSVADTPFQRVILYSGVVALIIGECTWALNYWQISAFVAGLFLILIFYVIVNVAHQYFLERLSWSVVVEFALVAIVALIVVLFKAP